MRTPIRSSTPAHRIVIVGGGAAGLELATSLGNTLGRKGQADITLIDRARTHIWKPKLHEIAAGSMDVGRHELNYLAQAHWHHFHYRLGEMNGLDRANKLVHVAPFIDEDGVAVTTQQSFAYDTLVMAVGSRSNDFGTPGVDQHALKLETLADAERFHRRMLDACIRAHAQTAPLSPSQLHVAVIGAGATGVELVAQLHRTTREVVAFGLDRIDPERDIQLHLIEAADRILPALSPRISAGALDLLNGLGIKVHTSARVSGVAADSVQLASGEVIPAELLVWAAGIKAPGFLKDIDGLETNRINQLAVHQTLVTTRDENIFAMGDCAACPWPEKNGFVPPRAQAAHQQASHLAKQIKLRMAGKPLEPYHYRDFGSLVSLGDYSAVGSLMGGLMAGSLFIDGLVARVMYTSLYKMHELALHGFTKVALETLTRAITRRTESHVKLH
ncbi:NADH dehydrogenase [Rhodoferax sp. OV413]|uniref:NAD(P)/FAD-dependent oxidoreductase n=1 Tax=Rhodoferax sp. OV413 TaxID=1855285 RepID=UPI000890CAF7|nr:NAD(P)/FAD-dependent oxidoreductase [Rhodoferax sp. OV413]SDP58605.1 NADH dehydrogenase [Rhodoferax sp. OV413]